VTLAGLRERVSLRTQLVVVVVALSALTVLATSLVAAWLLRADLLGRVDDQLLASARPVVESVTRGDGGPDRDRDDGDPLRPSEFYVSVLDASGTVLATRTPTTSDVAPPALPTLDASAVTSRDSRPFTVPAETGRGSWRVLALTVGSGAIAIALPLTDLQATLRHLLLIDALVAVVALAVLALLARWAVTASLRPLVEVEETAEAIAAGDLSRRVPPHPATTEVGRLSASLNTMLGRIETAVGEQQQAAAAAQASETRMRRFVADASHELRTPLTSLRGFAELYRQGAVPAGEDLDATMRRIETEAERMGLLVDDLLLLARLDQQRPLQREPVDLVPLATEVAHDAAVLAPDHPVTLTVPPGGASAPVLADADRLRQVLVNLVRNAVRHTPAGTSVQVAVGVSPGSVTVTVADDGPGMSEQDAERAFERFYRADSSRSRVEGSSGSGLGLSIVAALVAAHGGTVDLTTATGVGTTVAVALPAAPPPSPSG
jgi:two-component system OmpR family sensor kinase